MENSLAMVGRAMLTAERSNGDKKPASTAIKKGNLFWFQYRPEKSLRAGESLQRN
jgi:imidazoleglycerol phosphate synthase glutamine amidotransferase subunit HisH